LITKILLEPEKEQQSSLIRQAIDLAKLAQNLLKGEELTRFINRSVKMI
jgi:molecular chaperone HtpG